MKEKKDAPYGHITIGAGKPEQKEVAITEYLRSTFIDNRFVSVIKLENDAFVVSVENLVSSGREPVNQMYLSKESFVALISTAMLYFSCKNEDINDLLKEVIQGKEINYTCSDNIKPLNP